MRLNDADHPGEEGTVYVNSNGPLQLPADLAWGDAAADATLSIPVDYLVEGTNEVRFGEGTRDRTYYEVGQLALAVWGDACAGPEDIESDAGPEPDVSPGPQPDTSPEPEPCTGDEDCEAGTYCQWGACNPLPEPEPIPDAGADEDVGADLGPLPDVSETPDADDVTDLTDLRDIPLDDRTRVPDGGEEAEGRLAVVACACRTTGRSGAPLLLGLILAGLIRFRRNASRADTVLH